MLGKYSITYIFLIVKPKWRLCRPDLLDNESKCVRQSTVFAHLVVDAFPDLFGLLKNCRFATIVIPQLCDGIAIHLMLVLCLAQYVTDVAQRDCIFVCINYSSPRTQWNSPPFSTLLYYNNKICKYKDILQKRHEKRSLIISYQRPWLLSYTAKLLRFLKTHNSHRYLPFRSRNYKSRYRP